MSPPVAGPVRSFSEVVLGGWSSYETSECQRSMLGKESVRGEEALLYTTIFWGGKRVFFEKKFRWISFTPGEFFFRGGEWKWKWKWAMIETNREPLPSLALWGLA